MRNNANKIKKALDGLYPNAKCELNHATNFQLLVAVVLSAQTTDKKVNTVTPVLFKKYPDAKKLAKAEIDDVEKIIKSIGLAHNKAINIVNLSKMLIDKYNGEVPNNREDLESLPGVGRKTANVVLNNCFDYPAFAVDTHVSRVSKRLNIANENDDVKTIEEKLMTYFPKKDWGKLHHQFIFFGRYKCFSRNPDCLDCPLKNICNYLE